MRPYATENVRRKYVVLYRIEWALVVGYARFALSY
jgi:hypothetical protein